MSALPVDILSALSSRALNLILFSTEKCNFRCTYCYEKFENGRMRPETISGVKELLRVRASELDRLVISWFGGEPLMATDIVLDISAYAKTLSEEFSVSYASNITTNAYFLDAPTFSRLCVSGISLFQISLDGINEQHDLTRKKIDGTGTFQRLIKNLRAIRDQTVDSAVIVLRLHYSPESVLRLSDTVDFLEAEFSSDRRFKIYVKALEKLGGKNDPILRTFTAESQIQIAAGIKQRIAESGMTYSIENNSRYICYAAKANSFGIRPTGEVVKCTVALSDPRNTIGQIHSDGHITFDHQRLPLWLTGLMTNDTATLACPYKNMGNNIKSNVNRESITPRKIIQIVQR